MKLKKILIYLVLVLTGISGIAQTFTVSGTVTDKVTGETLIGATVMDKNSGKGTITNSYGYYSLTLPGGEVVLRVSYVGYKTICDSISGNGDRRDYAMDPATSLEEVVITADRITGHKSSQMSAIEVPVEQLRSVPVIFGEADVLKALQLLPGVQSGTEGMSGMYVRGGGPDENLFLLDGVPLYNVNHLGGFFSAFNSDAIKNVTLYKGSFPAHFGGRLSSVLDITTNNGNDKEYHGNVSVGLISAKVSVEGPIVKEKTTFSLSARRTYGDVLIQPFVSMVGLAEGLKTNVGYYFYDLNAKVTHKFSNKSRLYASFYSGDDDVYFRIKTRSGLLYANDYNEFMSMKYKWGNLVGSIRWNYELNPKLFMNVSGSYTRYRNNISLGEEIESWYGDDYTYEMAEMSYKSGIRDITGRADFDYAPNNDHAVKFGGNVTYHLFSPETFGVKMEEDYDGTYTNMDTTIGMQKIRATELNGYIEDDWSLSESLKLNGGVLLSGFGVQGKFYPSVQPRLSGRWLLSDDLSIKAGYSYMTQYMHLLSNTSINLPTDLWVPVTARIAPMNAHQVAVGVFYNLKNIVDLSVEGYYKSMSNLMEYKDGASFFGSSLGWEDKVCMGDGWAYGVEFLAQKTLGDFTGWIGYTWSKTERRFDRPGEELNQGRVFPAKYDRRHDVSIVLMYKPNKKFDCSLTWVYNTGNATTLALQRYNEEHSGDYGYYQLDYVESRNNFRMPAYHRMDVSVNFHKQKKHGVRTWSVSVYNLYNRQNPFIIYQSDNYHYNYDGVHYGSALVQLSIFPILPSLSYIYKF